MTNFVTVLRRAVESLDDNNVRARAAIYDRARSALEAQLMGLDPPLPPDELERQLAELDESIATVEAEVAQDGAPLREADEQGDRFFAPDEPPEAAPHDEPEHFAAPEAADDWPHHEPEPDAPTEHSENDVTAGAASQERPHGGDDPHASFRSAVAETAALGAASAQAARSARSAYGDLDDAPADAYPEPSGPEDDQHGFGHDGEANGVPATAVAAGTQRHPSDVPPQPAPASYDDDYESGGRGLGVAMWVIVFLMVAGIAGAAYWQRDALTEVVAAFDGEADPVETAEEPKLNERVPAAGPEEQTQATETETEAAPAAPASAEPSLPADAARVAQALLVEEGPNSSVSSLGGSVDWSLLDDPEAPPEAAKVIRGMVQVPDKGLTLTLAIRRNTDPDLPASHTVELLFDMPRDFENDSIAGVAGLVMKATPQSSGQPLIGAVVPVTDEFYLLGLSESDFDRARNLDELRRRDFIDIPIVYGDESRAILSIAKGESGKEVFQQAFEAWGH